MISGGYSFFRAKAFQSDHEFPLEWLNLHRTLSRSLMMIMKTHGSNDIDTLSGIHAECALSLSLNM